MTRDGTDLTLGVGRLVTGRAAVDEDLVVEQVGDAVVLVLVLAATVGRASHLGGHLVEGQVEGAHLVLGGRLGPDDRTLGEGGQLEADGAVGLTWVALVLDLHLDADDPMVVLLEPGELLGDMTAEAVRELTVSAGDDHVHGYLQIPVGDGMEPVRPTWSSTPQPPAEGFAASRNKSRHYYPSPLLRHV